MINVISCKKERKPFDGADGKLHNEKKNSMEESADAAGSVFYIQYFQRGV